MTSREFGERLLQCARNAGVSVTPAATAQLESYYRLLARWNPRINLTALPLHDSPSAETIDRLLIEPLAAARFVPHAGIRWFDLGSGGGSPALPLKIVRPAARLTMVESRARKAAFLREAVRTLQLTGADVVNRRFEEVAGGDQVRGQANLVTVRAVKVDEALLEAAASLLSPQGLLLLFSPQGGPLSPISTAQFVFVERARLTSTPSASVVILRRHEQ